MMSLTLAGRLLVQTRPTMAVSSTPFAPQRLRAGLRAISSSNGTKAGSPGRGSRAHAPHSRFSTVRRLTTLGLLTGTLAGTAIFIQDARAGAVELEELNERNPVGTSAKAKRDRQLAPLSTLLRTYVVYSFCSVPALVDWAPAILETLSSIPGLKQITEAVVRATFFDQVRMSSFRSTSLG